VILLNQAEHLLNFLTGSFCHWLFALSSSFSVASLASALCLAILFLLLRRRPGKKDVKFHVMLRALFPGWLYRSRSFRADFGFLIFNVFAWATLFGWAVLSSDFISHSVNGALAHVFGALPAAALNDFSVRVLATISLFLAYELGYWTNHYLSHRIPLLWEFHKVHHTAEVLSPMTNYRVHPVDTVVFYNFLAIFIGVTRGVLSYGLGRETAPFAVDSMNAILLAFVFVTVHLQHSHMWIAATGRLGLVILSPAHHQLHHSGDPVHFNKNFGSCLALWDWLFGTLHLPTRERQRLSFGVEPRARIHHTAIGGLVLPFVRAWEVVRPAQAERPELNAAAPR
jgi:sterol desaturase/sphingolipid hydroxylase (fatty acid hydroxylase superfamily)